MEITLIFQSALCNAVLLPPYYTPHEESFSSSCGNHSQVQQDTVAFHSGYMVKSREVGETQDSYNG